MSASAPDWLLDSLNVVGCDASSWGCYIIGVLESSRDLSEGERQGLVFDVLGSVVEDPDDASLQTAAREIIASYDKSLHDLPLPSEHLGAKSVAEGLCTLTEQNSQSELYGIHEPDSRCNDPPEIALVTEASATVSPFLGMAGGQCPEFVPRSVATFALEEPYQSEGLFCQELSDEEVAYEDQQAEPEEELPQECWVLWVGSLEPRVEEDDLLDAFSRFGPIWSVTIKQQQQDGVYSSLGFVNFADQCSAEAAFHAMQGADLMGARVRLREPRLIRTPPGCGPWPINRPPPGASAPQAPSHAVNTRGHGGMETSDDAGWPSMAKGGGGGSEAEHVKGVGWGAAPHVGGWGAAPHVGGGGGMGRSAGGVSWARLAAVPAAAPSAAALAAAAADRALAARRRVLGDPVPMGDHFVADLVHPSRVFQACQVREFGCRCGF